MKLIILTKGFSAKVDDDLYPYLSQWKWHYSNGHAERKEYREGKQFHVLMHQVVLGERFVDHINGDPLDNRRENLRPANHSTNGMNMRKHRGKSQYKGVTPVGDNWRVQVWKDNQKAYDACFPNERWAAMAYDLNALALFGEYSRLNFTVGLVGIGVDATPE